MYPDFWLTAQENFAHCTVYNGPLHVLLVRLYKHDPSYKPCHTVGSHPVRRHKSQNLVKTDIWKKINLEFNINPWNLQWTTFTCKIDMVASKHKFWSWLFVKKMKIMCVEQWFVSVLLMVFDGYHRRRHTAGLRLKTSDTGRISYEVKFDRNDN